MKKDIKESNKIIAFIVALSLLPVQLCPALTVSAAQEEICVQEETEYASEETVCVPEETGYASEEAVCVPEEAGTEKEGKDVCVSEETGTGEEKLSASDEQEQEDDRPYDCMENCDSREEASVSGNETEEKKEEVYGRNENKELSPEYKTISVNLVRRQVAPLTDFFPQELLGELDFSVEKVARLVSVKNGSIRAKKAGRTSWEVMHGEEIYLICLNIYEPVFERSKYTVLKGESIKCGFEHGDFKPVYSIPAKYADRAMVDENGVVTGLSRGRAVLLSTINGVQYKTKIRVRDPYLSVTKGCVAKGGKLRIKLKDSDKSASWKTSDENIALVVKGRIRGLKKGQCVITCTYMDREYNCEVQVDEAALTTGELVLKCGETKRVGIYGISDPAYEEHWFTRSKSGAFTLTDNGAVTGVKKGSGSIFVLRGKKRYKVKIKVVDEKATDNSSDENYELIKVICDEDAKCHDIVEKVYANEANSMYVLRQELGHDPEESSFVPSTCVDPAYSIMKCRRCGQESREDKKLTDYPLKQHSLTNISEGKGKGAGSIWRCSVCGGDFVLTSGGDYVRLDDPQKDSSSSSGKDHDSSSGKDDGSSSGKDHDSSSGKDDGSSSGKDHDSSSGKDDGSSSGKDHDSSSGKDDGSSSGKDHGSSSGKDHDSSSGKDHDSSSGKDDGSSSGKDQGSSSEKTYDHSISYENTLSANNLNPSGYDEKDGVIYLTPLYRRGYEFLGWFDEDGNEIDRIYTSDKRNRVITARWELIEYRITYEGDPEKCEMSKDNPTTYTVLDDIELINPVPLEGYEFSGWTGGGLTGETMRVVIPAGSVGSRTYSAHFVYKKYRIDYVMNGGENDPDNPSYYTMDDEIVFREPFRQYYSFDGFYTSGVLSAGSLLEKIEKGSTGDLRLYAKWNKNTFIYEAEDVDAVYNAGGHSADISCDTPGTTISYRDSKDETWSFTKPVYIDAGEYVTYYRLEKDNYETLTGHVSVTVDKAPGQVSETSAINSVYDGSAKKLMNTASSSTGKVLYGMGNTSIGNYYEYIPTAVDAGSYYVWYYSVGDRNHYDSDKKCVIAKIDKAEGRVKTAPTAKSLTYNGVSQTLINSGSAEGGTMQYRLGSASSFASYLPTATDAGVYTVYYYCSGDANHYDSSISSVNITIAKKNMSLAVTNGSFGYTGSSGTGGAKVVVNEPGSGYTLTYGTTLGVYDKTSMPSFSAVGTHTVYYRVEAANYNVATGSFTITVDKGTGSCTAPSARSLTYSGAAQSLVNAGSSSTGTMYYSLKADSGFSTGIPTAVNAGSYTVYYYSKGNSNYHDTSLRSVKVTIAKASLNISYSATSFYKTGYPIYPDIKVSSSAKLSGDEKVCVYIKNPKTGGWYTFKGSDVINPGYSSSLPFTFVLKKSNSSHLTEYYNVDAGTYSMDLKSAVLNGGYGGTDSGNFNVVTTTCTYTIVNYG